MANTVLIGLIEKSVAIAIDYTRNIHFQPCKLLIYNFGIHSFEASILEYDGFDLRSITSGGSPHIGSEHIDSVIFEILKNKIKQDRGINKSR